MSGSTNFPQPTLDDLRAQTRGFYAARLPGADVTLRRSGVMVAADAQAAVTMGEYIYLARMAQQLFLRTCTAYYLEQRAADYGISREGAVAAAGGVVFAGTLNTPIPAGTVLATSDGSVQFATQALATIPSGLTVDVAVVATPNSAGAAGNLPPGAVLTLVAAIAGIAPTAAVDGSGLAGGLDEESDASLRNRVFLRIQQPPQGGSPYDYVAWTKGNPGSGSGAGSIANPYAGVTRAWAFPKNRGLGTCDVTFVMDGRAPGSIIPLSDDLSAIQTQLEYVKAAGSVVAFACAADAIAVTIANLTPNTGPLQTAIQASLTALFATTTPGTAEFGDGVSTAAPGGQLPLATIYAAIQATAGVVSFDLVAPAADVVSAMGHLAELGAVTIT